MTIKFKHVMRTRFFQTALLVISITTFLLTSCTQDDNSADPTPAVVQDQMQSGGQWQITSFIDSGKDETSHFTGYAFTFGANGNLSATNNATTYQGQWSVTNSNSNDDSPGDVDFNIFFSLTNSFEDLNEDWHILSRTDTRIELIHVSGGNGGTDILVFTRI